MNTLLRKQLVGGSSPLSGTISLFINRLQLISYRFDCN